MKLSYLNEKHTLHFVYVYSSLFFHFLLYVWRYVALKAQIWGAATKLLGDAAHQRICDHKIRSTWSFCLKTRLRFMWSFQFSHRKNSLTSIALIHHHTHHSYKFLARVSFFFCSRQAEEIHSNLHNEETECSVLTTDNVRLKNTRNGNLNVDEDWSAKS